jgi:archaellum component FlaF (FlaF/FlaG flagellin family)
MSLQKSQSVDQIEVTKSGAVQVRTALNIIENGIVISSSYHRHVVSPGDDYSKEDDRVQTICAVAHTADVIAAYKAAIAAQGV